MRYVLLWILLLTSALLGQQQQNPASPQQPSEQTEEAGQAGADSSAGPAAEPAPGTGAAEANPSPEPAAPQASPAAGGVRRPRGNRRPPARRRRKGLPARPPRQPNQARPSSSSRPGGLSFRFRGASLHEFIDVVAKSLAINYILDPGVGDAAVTINTYGRLRRGDLLPLLREILKIHGAVAVQVGNLYRIVPSGACAQVAHFSTLGRRPRPARRRTVDSQRPPTPVFAGR